MLPLGAYSLDLTRPGPIGVLGQPLPAGDFTLVAKVSAPGLDADVGGQGSTYAQVGLKIFQTNDNWIKVAHTRNADGNPTGSTNTYFELAYETNGTRTLGTRMGLAAGDEPADLVDARGPHRDDDHAPRTRSPIPTARARTGSTSAASPNIDTRDAGGDRPALHRRLRRQRLDLGALRLPPVHAGLSRSTPRRP